MQEETRVYEGLAAHTLSYPNLTDQGDPVRLDGGTVSASLFDLLGVRPVLGRTFAALRNLLERVHAVTSKVGRELSMGMTNDLEIAIREGSTMVRIGTALFGERNVT